MPAAVNIDGRILAPAEARVSVFDRGFLYGDSVYASASAALNTQVLINTPLTVVTNAGLWLAERVWEPAPRVR